MSTDPRTGHPAAPTRVTRVPHADEAGYSTAELLGNAALAIAALVVIWAAIGNLGGEVIDWIQAQIVG